jgi:hypothetical protein
LKSHNKANKNKKETSPITQGDCQFRLSAAFFLFFDLSEVLQDRFQWSDVALLGLLFGVVMTRHKVQDNCGGQDA